MKHEDPQEMNLLAVERRWWRPAGALWVLCASLLVTLVMAWPVLRSPSTRLFGTEIVGWHHSPYTVIEHFEHPRPLGTYTQPATDYIGALLARLVGGVAAYNAIVLVTFPLAALFTYLLAFHLTGSIAAASTASFVFAFSPFHLAQGAYHAHTVQVQWLPLYFLALWLCLENLTLPRAGLLVLAAALVTFSSFYYGFIAAVITPVALLAYWFASMPAELRRNQGNLLFTVALLESGALIGLLYVFLKAPQVLSDPAALAFAHRDLFAYSARWWAYFLPSVEHPVFGTWAARIWDRHGTAGVLEQQITLGFALAALAGAAVAAWVRGRRDAGLNRVPALVLVAAAAFLCSLSPERKVGPFTIPRPSGVLYEIAPMFRAYARFGVVVLLMTALLAGMGAALLLRNRRRSVLIAGVGLLAACAFELTPLPSWRYREILPTRAHLWMAESAGEYRVLDCADWADPREQTVRRLFGLPTTLLRGGLEDCGEPHLAGKLAAAGLTHMLVRRESPVGRWLADAPAPDGFSLERQFEDASLYRVTGGQQEFSIQSFEGFHRREYRPEGSWRWMGERGGLRIENAAGKPVKVVLAVVLQAFAEERTLAVSLDGAPLQELRVGVLPAPYALGPFLFTPGLHRLTLMPDRPAVAADDVLHNGDGRVLSFALWEWRWLPAGK